MRIYIHIACLWLAAANAWASPTIQNVEYFFNVDPGIGNATPLAIPSGQTEIKLDTVIPFSGLPTGKNTLYLRVQNSDGEWGSPRAVSITVMPATSGEHSANVNQVALTFTPDQNPTDAIIHTSSANTKEEAAELIVPIADLPYGAVTAWLWVSSDAGEWGFPRPIHFTNMPATSGTHSTGVHQVALTFAPNDDPNSHVVYTSTAGLREDTAELTIPIDANTVPIGTSTAWVWVSSNGGTWGFPRTLAVTHMPNSFAIKPSPVVGYGYAIRERFLHIENHYTESPVIQNGYLDKGTEGLDTYDDFTVNLSGLEPNANYSVEVWPLYKDGSHGTSLKEIFHIDYSHYEEWVSDHFTQVQIDAGDAEFSSDADGDGIINGLEFTLDLYPHMDDKGTQKPILQVSTETVTDIPMTRMIITMRSPAEQIDLTHYEASGLTYIIEQSETMQPGSWVPLSTSGSGMTSSLQYSNRPIKEFHISVPSSPTTSIFYRVRIGK